MLSQDTRIFFPDTVEVAQRNHEFAFWAPRRRVAVKVGAAGKSIFELCRADARAPGRSILVSDVVAGAARELGMAGDAGRQAVLDFLDRMVELDFLTDDPAPARRRQPQPVSRFKPVVMYLHLTVHCNLSCSYCYNVEHRQSAIDERALSRHEYLQLIEDAAAIGVRQMNFTGGEPLLSRDWPILVRRARELGITPGLLTNGAVINDRNAASIAELFNNTIISLDSAVPEEHDQQRGRGSHARTMRGIRALRRTGYRNLTLRPVLTRHNLDSLKLYPAFAAEQCGTTKVLLSPYAPNSVEEERDLQLRADTRALRQAMQEFDAAMRAIGGTPAGHDRQASEKAAARCGAGAGIVSIDFNGDAYPCQAIHNPAMKMGNIRVTPIMDLGDSEPSRAFRRSDPAEIDICKTCNFNEICGGGCRAVAFSIFRSMAAHNPYVCETNKAQAWDRIWAGLDRKPAGGAINPAEQNCQSASCGSPDR